MTEERNREKFPEHMSMSVVATKSDKDTDRKGCILLGQGRSLAPCLHECLWGTESNQK